MALTKFQRDVCQLLAHRRRASGESYVAGGAALGVAVGAARVSRDLDIFHDTADAVRRSWLADRAILEDAGLAPAVVHERDGYVEAELQAGDERLLIEWTRDSAFRFFPLVEDDVFGLTLHPFDLATNKVLALVGRLETRDWLDVLACHEKIQPLGLLAWAACGKDPGFTPPGLLAHARRSSRYTQADLDALPFDGPRPVAADLAQRWHAMLADAERIIDALPADRAGEAVLDVNGHLLSGNIAALLDAVQAGRVTFHGGRLGGAWPTVRPA